MKHCLLVSMMITICAAMAQGQNQQVEQLEVILADTIAKPRLFRPTMLLIGVDAVTGLSSIISSQKNGWEMQAEIDLHRYFLVAEYGRENLNISDSTYLYTSSGNYWRFGIDANLIPRDAFGSILYFGLRYGKASFKDSMVGSNFEPFWGDIPIDEFNDNVTARWLEVVTGMKAKVWKNLYLGYILRLKFAKKIIDKEELNLDPFRIPGYGLADQNSFWGVNYYIAWKFTFGEKYILPPKQ